MLARLFAGFAVVALASPSSATAQQEAAPETIAGPAVALYGDTLLIEGRRLRLFGALSPEMATREGPFARAALDDLIGGAAVACAPVDRERYGRAVALCTTGGRDLGEALIAAGWATAYRVFTHAAGADSGLAARYDLAEARARTSGLGLWAKSSPADSAALIPLWRDWRFWQLVVAGLGAFLGFLGATLVKYHLDRRRDEWLRDRETRGLISVLHAIADAWRVGIEAELNWFRKHKLPDLHKLPKTDEVNIIKYGIYSSDPTLPLLDNVFDKIGLLPAHIAARLFGLYEVIDKLRSLTSVGRTVGEQIVEIEGMIPSFEEWTQGVAEFIADLEKLEKSCRAKGRDT
ncbi:MAG: thermonuclease family protein [Dongiaceae bacterium]